MTTDPVQEARDEVIATAHDVHTDAQLIVALDAYAAAILREEAELARDPLASIPAEAREAIAAWLGLHAKPYEDIEEREIERVMEAMEGAWCHLPTLAAALRGGGDA